MSQENNLNNQENTTKGEILKPFDLNDQQRIQELNETFEKPKNGILSKAHKLLLGAVLATGVSSASAGENNKTVELFSNPPTNSEQKAPNNTREYFSNSPDMEYNKRANIKNGSVQTKEYFSNPPNNETDKRIDDRNKPKPREYFSN